MKRQNHWHVNGMPISNPNHILPTVIEHITDLRYWSADALKELYLGTLEMGIEMAKEEKKCKKGVKGACLTRFINTAPNKIKFLPSDQIKLLQLHYSAILASEGLSPLNGFGISNKWGDSIKGNPEIQSIRRKQQGELIMTTELKRSDYLAAAKDLINTMGLKDDKGKPLPIDAKSNVAQLTTFIQSAAEEIDPGSDEFKESTLSVLKAVGYTGFDTEEADDVTVVEEPPAPAPETPKKKKAAKEVLADNADAPDEPEWKEPEPAIPLTLPEAVAAAKRLADLKDLVTGNIEFKKLVPKLKSFQGLAGPRMLKAEMQKIVGVVEVKKPADKPAGTGASRPKGSSEETLARRAEMEKMISSGKFTLAQIAEKIAADFNRKVVTIRTELTDGKNPKYNKFSKLVKTNENGILSF